MEYGVTSPSFDAANHVRRQLKIQGLGAQLEKTGRVVMHHRVRGRECKSTITAPSAAERRLTRLQRRLKNPGSSGAAGRSSETFERLARLQRRLNKAGAGQKSDPRDVRLGNIRRRLGRKLATCG